MSASEPSRGFCGRFCSLFSRLCTKRSPGRTRVSAGFRISTTFNSSMSNPAVNLKEMSSFMRQLYYSRRSSGGTNSFNQSIDSKISKDRKQMSLASGRSFYRQLMQKHEGEMSLTCAEDYHDVAGVPILGIQIRVPQSRLEADKRPAMRPRMNSI